MFKSVDTYWQTNELPKQITTRKIRPKVMTKKLKICVNIGHGGIGSNYDSGAIAADGTHEYIFNKERLLPHLQKALESKGHKVIVIGQNKTFSELPARINAEKPDVIISLHYNAFNKKATGSEVLYWKTSSKSKKLAELVQSQIVGALGLANRGAKGLSSGRGSALLKLTNAPCVILEPFFGDNPNDWKVANEKIKNLAEGIADGIEEWIEFYS